MQSQSCQNYVLWKPALWGRHFSTWRRFWWAKQNAGIAFVRAVLQGQCCEYTIGQRASKSYVALLHTLTFSEGEAEGWKNEAALRSTKVHSVIHSLPLLLTQSNWFVLSFFFQPRLRRSPPAQDSCYLAGNFFNWLVAAVNPDTAGFENHRNIRQRKLFGV